MMKITTVGLDWAKGIFTVHGVDAQDKAVLRKTVRRAGLLAFFAQLPPCVVGMEACSGAQHWARELRKLGHDPRIMAAEFVTPYRQGGKNDANDAAAICEAVRRPTMHFVAVKSVEQQAVLAVHRLRQGLVEERTALANRLRGLLAEYGVVIGAGPDRLRRGLPEILEDGENALPGIAREALAEAEQHLRQLDTHIAGYDKRIAALAKVSEPAQRLMKIEGVGPVTATALVASVGDAKVFHNGRQLAALLIHGARAVLRVSARHNDAKSRWVESLRRRRPDNVAAVALAAKTARISRVLLARGTDYERAV